jgi:CHAT domain-containing protein
LARVRNQSYDESGVPESLRNNNVTSANSLQSIPASETEARNIYSAFKKNSEMSELVLFRNATEDRMKLSDLNNFKYIHIASHGFVNQEEPEFSGVVFNADSTREDGILFSGEIYGLNLNCEMISLSACETGLGKIKEGEGIIGITRALIYAGAKNVNVSLWKVDDFSTSQLMTIFYSQLAELEFPESKYSSINYATYLRNAKQQMIKERTYSHPLYWSSFVLVGK